MASSRVMPTSNSRNSDLSRLPSTTSSNHHLHQPLLTPDFPSTMTVDGILHNVYGSNTSSSESTLLDAQITLIDTPPPQPLAAPAPPPPVNIAADGNVSSSSHRTAEDVWRDIVSGKEMKDEGGDEMMTLEDFLSKAGAVEEEDVVNIPAAERLGGGVFAFDTVPQGAFQQIDKVEGSVVAFGNGTEVIGGGRGKRGRTAVLEPLDKAAQQRQRRMIKNRESAARSRERKQAHQVELESLAARLEDENEQLLKEKAERTKERLKQLKETIIPVLEKRRPKRPLRRVSSMEW